MDCTDKYIKWREILFWWCKGYDEVLFDRNSYGEYNDLTKDKIADIIITDYYSQKPIDGIKAYYVIGSDVNGPMGEELIPFSSIESAKTFLQDHHGQENFKI